MKTPKEILFARHRPAESKLDAIRQEAVAAVCDQRDTETRSPGVAVRRQSETSWWRQLVWPGPQAWAGLAAVWILIFALKIATHDQSHAFAKKSPVPPEAIAELRQQQLLFAELIGWREPVDPEPPKSNSPKPRSERRCEMTLV